MIRRERMEGRGGVGVDSDGPFPVVAFFFFFRSYFPKCLFLGKGPGYQTPSVFFFFFVYRSLFSTA